MNEFSRWDGALKRRHIIGQDKPGEGRTEKREECSEGGSRTRDEAKGYVQVIPKHWTAQEQHRRPNRRVWPKRPAQFPWVSGRQRRVLLIVLLSPRLGRKKSLFESSVPGLLRYSHLSYVSALRRKKWKVPSARRLLAELVSHLSVIR